MFGLFRLLNISVHCFTLCLFNLYVCFCQSLSNTPAYMALLCFVIIVSHQVSTDDVTVRQTGIVTVTGSDGIHVDLAEQLWRDSGTRCHSTTESDLAWRTRYAEVSRSIHLLCLVIYDVRSAADRTLSAPVIITGARLAPACRVKLTEPLTLGRIWIATERETEMTSNHFGSSRATQTPSVSSVVRYNLETVQRVRTPHLA